MRKFTNLAIAIGAGLCFGATAQADDLRFTTLPQTVQTTVIRETRIPDASSVTQIFRDSSGIYAVTVRGTAGLIEDVGRKRLASEFSVLQGNRLTHLRIHPNRTFATIPARIGRSSRPSAPI
jgi:hypothetical protein